MRQIANVLYHKKSLSNGKIFRKIRQRLLSENKFSKYLIYAIGEIILVVIGILIALGINNWNENRKNKDDEKIILINLNEDLKTDSSQFAYYGQQFKEIDQLHLELFKLAHEKLALDSISEPILLRRLLFFKQLVDIDFKDNLKEIANLKINNALTNYVRSVQDMEMIYRSRVTPLINDQLKPLLAENNIYKQDNIRLREFSVGYNVPNISSLGLDSMYVQLVGRNLFYFDKAADDIDPEGMLGNNIGGQGISSGNLPTSTSLGLNLTLKF